MMQQDKRQDFIAQCQQEGRFTVVNHPVVKHKMTLLRDKNTPSAVFRRLVKELTYFEAYPATQALPVRTISVETPLVSTMGYTLEGVAPVIVPILRAGLAMADALCDVIPSAPVAHLGMFRNEETHEPLVYYEKYPNDIAKHPVLLVDPMLATGGSMVEAITELRALGVKDIITMVLVASPQGVERVMRADASVQLFTCALDEGLNSDAYIMPGLGDAGDRIFDTLDATLNTALYN